MMKQLGKKFTAVLLAAMMVLSLAVMASAATTQTAGTYSVTAQADKILFTRNGASASYPIKTANIKLTTDKDGDLLVCFTDSTGKARNVTVGKQTSLTLSGPMASLTLAKELNDGVAVTLGATANVTTMTVDTPNPVAINGKVAHPQGDRGRQHHAGQGRDGHQEGRHLQDREDHHLGERRRDGRPDRRRDEACRDEARGDEARRLFLRLHRLEGRLPRQDRFDLLGRG